MATSHRMLPAAALAASLTVTGCSDDGDAEPTAAPSSSATQGAAAGSEVPGAEEIRASIEDGATVIDVRTPEEFAAGHLRGARNLDVNAPDFADRVAELDPAGDYVLYCASGNRAGQARQLMLGQGFTDVVNAGGFEDLAASGFATAGRG